LQQNSLLNRTGNFCEGNREFVRENREFERGELQSDFRMTFSEGAGTSNVCPAPNRAVALDLSARLPLSLMLEALAFHLHAWFSANLRALPKILGIR
jgi:hypothetical protein